MTLFILATGVDGTQRSTPTKHNREQTLHNRVLMKNTCFPIAAPKQTCTLEKKVIFFIFCITDFLIHTVEEYRVELWRSKIWPGLYYSAKQMLKVPAQKLCLDCEARLLD